MKYKCLRCGYKTDYRSHIKRHLKRKRICLPKLEDIDVIELYENLENNDLTDEHYLIFDINQDNEIDILDIVFLINLIL